MNVKAFLVSILYRKVHPILIRLGLKKFHFTHKIDDLIHSFLKSEYTEIEGHKMYLDSKDTFFLSTKGYHEPIETELIKKYIQRGAVVLDAGANIGYFTLIFARLVGDEGKVFAFEPDPENFALLKKNVEINGYQNVVIEQKAISNKTGKARLYLYEDHKGKHRIFDPGEGQRSIEIDTLSLDDYFERIDYDGSIAFIKIDIEGAEPYAIQGMTSVLNRSPSVKLLTEFNPYALRISGSKPETYLNLLIKLGFTLYHVIENENRVKPVIIDKFIETYIGELDDINLLCIREG